MLDLKRIREHPDKLKLMLSSRFLESDGVDVLLQQDALHRRLAADSKAKKALRNQMSKKLAEEKRQDPYSAEVKTLRNEMLKLGSEIAVIDVDIAELDDKINTFLLSAPNYPHPSVPSGRGESDNEEFYRWSAPRMMIGEPKPYWNIGSNLGILDFNHTVKPNSSQFAVYRDLGSQLEHAVASFFLDTYIRAGYREVTTPYTVKTDRIDDPLQLPDFQGSEEKSETLRIPLVETSTANLYRDIILDKDALPVLHCAFPASFRSNAAESNSGGMIRQRQFPRVELLNLCRREDSYDELASMTEQAQKVLQLLELPYRVNLLCVGELSFAAAKTYILEVWMPGYGQYLRVSNCTNCEDFIARRLNIRYCEKAGDAPQYCHTLSGSGIAVGRIVAAILENCQNEDGTVTVPKVLRDYMHTDTIR